MSACRTSARGFGRRVAGGRVLALVIGMGVEMGMGMNGERLGRLWRGENLVRGW